MTQIEQIKEYVMKQFNIDKKDDIEMKNISGHSGSPVFMIYGEEKKICVVKIFSTIKSFNNELESYKFFSSIGVKTPEIFSHKKCKEYFLLFMTVLNIPSIGSYIKKNFGNNDLILKVGKKIGELARKIHDVKKVSIDDMMKSANITNDVICKKLQKNVRFTKGSTSMIKKYLENPGNFTYCHGDMNLDNLFVNNYDEKNDIDIIVIDGGNYNGTRYNDLFNNKENLPNGLPACDYNRFIGSVTHMIKNKNIHKVSGNILIEGFVEGYGNKYEVFTKEADDLFKYYWMNSCKYTLKY